MFSEPTKQDRLQACGSHLGCLFKEFSFFQFKENITAVAYSKGCILISF